MASRRFPNAGALDLCKAGCGPWSMFAEDGGAQTNEGAALDLGLSVTVPGERALATIR